MELSDYQTQALCTLGDYYKDRQSLYAYLTSGLSGEAGEFASAHAKHVRGDYGEEEFRKRAKGELGDILWFISVLANSLGFSMDTIAESNLEKLRSRKERDAIRGDGDNR